MRYRIDLGAWNSVFAVPTVLVDRHLKLAGAVQLKALLWLLRHGGEPADEDTLSAALGVSRGDVADAMLYWESCGLIVKEDSGYRPAPRTAEPEETDAPAAQTAAQAEPLRPAAAVSAAAAALPARPQKPDNAFVAKRMQESAEIASLMQEAQLILGRLINNGDSATLLMMHDYLGLPTDVILMLLQYTVSIGKSNMRYIEKTAIGWADEEINTHEKAEEKIRRLNERAQAWNVVEQTLGITHRSPTRNETELSTRWVQEWHFSPDLIREAYERCVDQTGKMNLRYMNKILERWHREGILTLEQAKQEQEQKHAARREQEERRVSYDIDSFEKSGAFDEFHS